MATSFAQLKEIVPQQIALWQGQLRTGHPNLNEIFQEVMHCRAQLNACDNPGDPPVFCWLQTLTEIDGTIKSVVEGWLASKLADLGKPHLEILQKDLENATKIGDRRVDEKLEEIGSILFGLEFEVVGAKSRTEEISLAIVQGNHEKLKKMRPTLSFDEALFAMEEYIKTQAWENPEDWYRHAMQIKEESAEAQALMLYIHERRYDIKPEQLKDFAESIEDVPALVRGLRRLLKLEKSLLVDRLLACPPLNTYCNADLLTLRGERLLFACRYQEALELFDQALAIDEGHKEALKGQAVALSQLGRQRETEHAVGRLQQLTTRDQVTARARKPLEDELERRDALHHQWMYAAEECTLADVELYKHDPVLGPFCQVLVSNLNTKFDGIYSAASRVVARAQASSADTVAKVLSFIPIFGTAFGWGVSERFNTIFTRRCQVITEMFTERAEIKPHVMTAAQTLTERYRGQISLLDPEGRKALARCAAERIYNYLVYTEAKFTNEDFGREMALGVQIMRLSHGKLSICEVPVDAVPQDFILKTVEGAEWTVAGIFDCSEIVDDEGRAYFIPDVTDPKYGRRGCDPQELRSPTIWQFAPL